MGLGVSPAVGHGGAKMADQVAKTVTEGVAGADAHIAPRPPLSLKEQKDLLRDGHAVGFHCAKCRNDRLSPMSRCPKCGSTDIVRREFSRTGHVVSYTIQSVASEQFLNETPFA